jgi:colicin import membrane protein
MSIGLQSLLETRRFAEDEAVRALADSIARRICAEAEQARLDECAAAAAARARAAAYDGGPTMAAGAWAAERYRGRLAEEARRAHEAALTHRRGEWRAAREAEEQARVRQATARQDREALEQLDERQQAERRRVAERRAEDAASELAGRRRA